MHDTIQVQWCCYAKLGTGTVPINCAKNNYAAQLFSLEAWEADLASQVMAWSEN